MSSNAGNELIKKYSHLIYNQKKYIVLKCKGDIIKEKSIKLV